MRNLGFLLVIVGVIALLYGGIGYNKHKTLFDVGDMHASVTEHKTLPISPIVGTLALIGGLALVVIDKRRVPVRAGS